VQPDEFAALVEYDEQHWWYVGRRRVLHAVLEQLTLPAGAQVLDAGCGSGRTMDDLAAYGEVHGFDLNPLGAEHARGRGHADVRVARVEEMPWDDASFDLVTCLDVIEHTPDDVASLRELRRVTRPGGWLVVTVPAYQFLWSSHDVANEHYRRYRRRQLAQAARAAGWEVGKWTYFNSVLFFPGAAVRMLERVRPQEKRRSRPQVALTPRAWDGALAWPMRFEAGLIRHGVSLPVGMSLLTVFRRPGANSAGAAAETPQVAGATVNNL
jgi:ubiquinone/menaquinone biosynthesis C-methylase UbiE